ncbi:MAG: hypothetical protein DRI71_08295 [Bacteroidetes bacterium]|nr:MAG: hypothetical protein DRI71_08295 [Bacteroidota bacterium]
MKRILKYITVIALMVSFYACEDPDSIRIPNLDNKGPNVRVAIDPDFGFFDFENLGSAKAKYDLFSISTNLEMVELRIFMTSGGVNTDTVTMRSYTQAEITAAGGVVLDEEITVQEMVDAIGVPGGLGAIIGGDNFTLLNRTTMADGTVYPSITVDGNSNVTPNIVAATATTSFFSNYVYFVGCPSDPLLFEGEYTSVITAGNYFGGQTNDDVTIAFKGPEPFRYVISDISALAYVPFGGTAYPGDMYDICGAPQMLPTNTFGVTTDTGGGSWDPVNGILILNVFESNNGLSWTIEFTRK